MAFEWLIDEFIDEELEKREKRLLEPFRLEFATVKQEAAIRQVAEMYGFEDLREFKGWMNQHDKDYYDIIKVVS